MAHPDPPGPSPYVGTTPGRFYTLHAISNPALFARHYRAIAAAGRVFLRGRLGIREYRFICAHVSADAMKKTGEPVEASIWLESPTRSLSIKLEPNECGEWIPSVESDRELQPWERRKPPSV